MKKISILCLSLFLIVNGLNANTLNSTNEIFKGEGQSSLTVKAVSEKIAGVSISPFASETLHVLMINIDATVTQAIEAVLYDANGKEVGKVTLNGKDSKTGKMDLGSLAQGKYKLRVIDTANKLQSTYAVIKSK